jgi:O-antigen/teichoic acid export membrane protein
MSSPTLRTISGVAGGNLFGMAIGLVGTLVQARFVSPAELGYFRQFSIVTGYAFFLQLGVFESVQRLYPYYVGRGEHHRALAIAGVAQAWNVVVGVLVSSVFVFLGVWTLAQGNWKASLGWAVQAIVVVGFIYGGYLGATYRSGHEFIRLAKASVLGSLVGVATLPLFALWPYPALALRAGLSSLVNLAYLHVYRPLKVAWRFSWHELFALVRGGVPMFIAGYGVSTGWSAVETTLVLKQLGTAALGSWTMAFMVLEAANKVPQAIVAVYTPKITEEFGRTGSPHACLRICRKPVRWGAPAMLLLAVVGAVGLWLVVPVLMPKYVVAIPAMCLMLLYLPVLLLEMQFVLLIAMGKVVAQNVVTYSGLSVFAALALAATHAGLGLNGVIGASLLGRLVRLVLIWAYLSRARDQRDGTLHRLTQPGMSSL